MSPRGNASGLLVQGQDQVLHNVATEEEASSRSVQPGCKG